MENTTLENTIKETLQSKDLNLDLPSLEFIGKASRIVASRKQVQNTNKDIFYLIAQFLNMKIKMYQVILVFITTLFLYFYTDKTKTGTINHSTTTQSQETNLPVYNYTVMTCVKQTKLI